MKNYFPKKILLVLSTIIIILIFINQILEAQSEKERKIIELVFGKEVITPARHNKDILQVAENITVITSEELELINAHTLTDALNNIPGVQIMILGGPGSLTGAYIQGSLFRHVLVMIDGVAMNNLADDVVDISAIPIQNIKKVEIVKGPASSSWGSSLGGIINIITKSPSNSKGPTGTCSTFYGEDNSTDFRIEASSSIKNFGYYFFGGNLNSDGLTEDASYNEDNLYSKLSWNLGKRTNLLFTLGYNNGSRTNFIIEDPYYSNKDSYKHLFSTLTFEHSINDDTQFKLFFRHSSKDLEHCDELEWNNDQIKLVKDVDDSSYGGSMDLIWTHGFNNIIFGIDVDRGKLESENVIGGKQYLEKWAVFSNDTIEIDRLSLTPGIRYDHTNRYGDHVSPSFGITYMITKRNLLRGYIARGFHIPPLGSTLSSRTGYEPNPDLKIEKIWSAQAGIESTALRYLWFKANLFRHNIWDGIEDEDIDSNTYTSINKRKQKRQGIELELKTVSYRGISLLAGFAYINTKNLSTSDPVPRYTYDIGITYYNNKKSFWAHLKGHYIYWDDIDQDPYISNFTQDHIFIWDINLIKELNWDTKNTIKTFFTIHNIFNGSPYQHYLNKNLMYENPGRWIEAGLKFAF